MTITLTPARWLAIGGAAAVAVVAFAAGIGGHPAAAASTLRDAAAAKNVTIGTAVTGSNLTGKYSATAAREFSSLTPGNEMKWGSIEPTRGQFNFAGADQIVAFAAANNQSVRGHTLLWHNQLPNWLTSGGFNRDQLTQIVQDHIATEVGRYAGKLVTWDVVNEPFNEDGTLRSTIFSQTIGPDYIPIALRAARQADPTAKLYINDFNIEAVNSKSTAMLNLVNSLRQQGVPIDGVGIQAHLILGQVPSSLQQNIARFTSAGFDVWISELDVRMNLPSDSTKLAQQASDYASVVRACLAVTRCVGVTVWGFTDFDSWVPGAFPGQGAADLFDQNIDPKPAYNSTLQALGGTPPTPTPTPTPTATPTPTPSPTPTATPTPPPGGNGGVTVSAVVSSASPWFNEEQVRLGNTGTLTALSITVIVQRTTGISFNGQYNTVGGQITQGNSSTTSAITYQFGLAAGQTLGAGSGRVFAAQTSGSGTAHPTAGDTFTVTYTTGGASFTQTGHF